MDNIPDDLRATFDALFAEAVTAGEPVPTAMTLATAVDGQPSARTVLLKAFDARGFVFYTHLDGRKGRELQANPRASLLFHWPRVREGVQVRIEGDVEIVADRAVPRHRPGRARRVGRGRDHLAGHRDEIEDADPERGLVGLAPDQDAQPQPQRVDAALGEALARRGAYPLARLITLNEPNMLALASYGAGVFPHEAPAMTHQPVEGFERVVRCLDGLLAAHAASRRA